LPLGSDIWADKDHMLKKEEKDGREERSKKDPGRGDKKEA